MAMIRPRKGATGTRWQWRVVLTGLPNATGTCPTKACAKECARKAEEELRSGGRLRGSLPFEELAALYEATYLPQIPDSAVLYRRHLRWWVHELGAMSADAITPQVIAAARTKLSSKVSKRGRSLSPATVNRYLVTLSSVFSWAKTPEVELVDRNPVRDVSRLKEPAGRVRWLSRPIDHGASNEASELERLLQACEQSRSQILYDAVVLLLSTGCRENEILRLRRDDIRLSEGGFTIPAERAKTEQPRFVALEGLGLEVVRRRLADESTRSEYLLPAKDNGPAEFPWSAWRVALRRAGISNLRPHDLRHTLGSYLAMMSRSLPEIKEALGHKSLQAAQRYIHLADSHKRTVSAAVNAEISSWLGR